VSTRVIGVDLGGSGARASLVRIDEDGTATTLRSAESAATGRVDSSGINAEHARHRLTALLGELRAGDDGGAVALGVGVAGLIHQGQHIHEEIPTWVADRGLALLVVCSDTLTSYLSGLGWQPGAVVAAGTGAVAVGFDGGGEWRRVDGWGYNVGDLGGGAWIGRHGLDAGLRAHDGRPGGSVTLLDHLVARFGSPVALAGELARRDDRAAVLASFARDVFQAAEAGDEVAVAVIDRAGCYLAESGVAALVPGTSRIAGVGGLLTANPRLTEAFARHVASLAPGVRLSPPTRTASEGAALLAATVWRTGELPAGTERLGARLITMHAAPGR
jgi:N-acetylglucosamine kinase-like BadF-type ATPase